MPLWKTTDTDTDGAKPRYIEKDPHIANTDVYATNQGWVHRKTYTDMHGNTRTKDEILVAIRGLAGAGKLVAATIVDARLSTTTMTVRKTANVIVTWNEQVDVNGVPTLTLVAANTTANTVPASLTASYVSGSGTNRLKFNFIADANNATYTLNTVTIANTQTLGICDSLTTAVASDLTIPADYTGANSAVGTVTATA